MDQQRKKTKLKKVAEIHIPSDIWVTVYQFLQTTKDFLSLYSLTRELHEFPWKPFLAHIEFKPKKSYNGLLSHDFSYVTSINFDNISLFKKIEGISRLKGIDNVNLKYHEFDGSELLNLKGIQTLQLNTCSHVTDQNLIELSGIKSLNLEDCELITGDCIKYFAGIRKLKLNGCYKVKYHGLEHLKGIHTLDVSYTEITDDDLIHLNGIHTLKMNACEKITKNGLSHLKGVQKLSLRHCSQVRDDSFEYLQDIPILDVSHCHLITGSGFGYLKGTQKLNISNCWNVIDEHFVHLRGIYSLDIRECNINGSGFKYLKGIYELNMSGCNKVVGTFLKDLGEVHTLDIHRCNQISDEDLSKVKITVLKKEVKTVSNFQYMFVPVGATSNYFMDPFVTYSEMSDRSTLGNHYYDY